jgi:hypothetical protein
MARAAAVLLSCSLLLEMVPGWQVHKRRASFETRPRHSPRALLSDEAYIVDGIKKNPHPEEVRVSAPSRRTQGTSPV